MAATIKIVVETSGGLDKVKNDIDDLGGRAKGAGGGFNALQEIATGALRAVGAMALDAAVKVGQFVTESIGKAGDFQAGMLAFGAAAGQGFEQGSTGLKEFQDLFLQLGKELPVSTQEVQDAAIALVKGGIDPAVIRAGALKDSLQFAAAAGMDLAKAAELTTKMLGTFVPIGASVEEQTKFMANAQELLVKAANASTLDVDKLGDAMLQAAGAAKGAGVDYQDFVTTMGLISPAFGSAAEAGTSFKNLIARLVPMTAPAAQAMEALGLVTEDGGNKFFDASGKFLGMQNAAAMLQGAFAGLSDAERTEALSTIFGNDAKGAALALISAGADGYQNFADKMAAANGVQQQAAATQQGFNFAMENLKGSLEALQITMGMLFLPALTAIVNQLNTGVGVVMGFVDAISTAPDPVAALGAAIMGVLPSFSTSGAAVGTLSGVLAAFLTTVQNVGNGYMAIFQAVLPIVQGFWTAHGTEIMAFLQQTWTTILQIIQTALQIYNAIVPPILQVVADFIAAHGAEITAFFNGAWQAISSLIDAALTLISGLLRAALQIIQGDWSGAWSTIQDMSARFVMDIVGVIQGAAGMLVAATELVVAAIAGVWNAFVSTAASIGSAIISGIANGIKSGIGVVVSAAQDAAQAAYDAAKAALGISSPSKLFMQVGGYMSEGMAIGMAQGAPMVAAAGAGVAGAAYAGATDARNYSRVINASFTYNSTPTPATNAGILTALAGV